ncbi:MAG: Asp-tRNA(Asn)/Glu-tRNA(Gln) amidotransferase subunit GatB [bacterium]
MSTKFYPIIGLEIHAELHTKTKMFCNSKNDPDEKKPNVNICPVCMAHPGTLPAINKEAVKHVLRVGNAIGGQIANFTEFDRKNYFYPDIPKGYQISQYKYPLVSGGSINGVAVTRVHLEEDTAKSFHREGASETLIDFNRAGVPLMELVTEPVVKSAKEAGDFARELQLILRYLGASEANMEKGEMRVEANISVSADPNKFGTKVEVKNLNSFKAVERAIDYEIKRHIELIEDGKGEQIVQETRGWDEFKQKTISQRKKESSHDYRYFPDPDLPKLWINEVEEFKNIKNTLPELPEQKRARFLSEFGLRNEAVEIFINEVALSKFFEEVVKGKEDKEFIKLASNYIISDLLFLMKKAGVIDTDEINEIKADSIRINPKDFSKLIEMIMSGELSSRGAKDVLAKMYENKGGNPVDIAGELGVIQKSDEGQLKMFAQEVLNENPEMATQYKNGKVVVLQFLVGQAMKKSKGAGNPKLFLDILKELLK